jgi:hypothetical protein
MGSFFHDNNILFITFIAFMVLVSWRIYTTSDAYNLKCVISGVDGKTYCVRDRAKLNKAADLFANVSRKCSQLVAYVAEKHPDDPKVQRLVEKFNPDVFCETLPTSEFTAYSENKGEKIAMCLNRKSKEDTESNMINFHTLVFVAIHELAHIMTEQENHPQIFWQNFKFLIQNAKKAKIHFPKDYKKTPQEYCGMTIGDNPFYDM